MPWHYPTGLRTNKRNARAAGYITGQVIGVDEGRST